MVKTTDVTAQTIAKATRHTLDETTNDSVDLTAIISKAVANAVVEAVAQLNLPAEEKPLEADLIVHEDVSAIPMTGREYTRNVTAPMLADFTRTARESVVDLNDQFKQTGDRKAAIAMSTMMKTGMMASDKLTKALGVR